MKTVISQSQIARTLCINKSTVSRELKRNTGQRSYRPKQAQDFFIQKNLIIANDTVIGKGHKGCMLVDRTTRETKIKVLPNRKADNVAVACVEMLARRKPFKHNFDNGKEFANHQKMEKELNTAIYFAKPYHSWGRGNNENTNGLIRQCLPKSAPLISD